MAVYCFALAIRAFSTANLSVLEKYLALINSNKIKAYSVHPANAPQLIIRSVIISKWFRSHSETQASQSLVPSISATASTVRPQPSQTGRKGSCRSYCACAHSYPLVIEPRLQLLDSGLKGPNLIFKVQRLAVVLLALLGPFI